MVWFWILVLINQIIRTCKRQNQNFHFSPLKDKWYLDINFFLDSSVRLYFLTCLRTLMWSSNPSRSASFTNQKLIYNLADPTNLGRLDSMPLHCSSSSFHVKMFLGLFFLLFLDVDINVMQCILVRKSTLATLCGTFPISLLYNPSTS